MGGRSSTLWDWAIVVLCAFNVVLSLSLFMYFIFVRKLHLSTQNYESYFKLALRCWTECLFGRPGSLDLHSLSTKERTFQDSLLPTKHRMAASEDGVMEEARYEDLLATSIEITRVGTLLETTRSTARYQDQQQKPSARRSKPTDSQGQPHWL